MVAKKGSFRRKDALRRNEIRPGTAIRWEQIRGASPTKEHQAGKHRQQQRQKSRPGTSIPGNLKAKTN
jgi:hypothetical protein